MNIVYVLIVILNTQAVHYYEMPSQGYCENVLSILKNDSRLEGRIIDLQCYRKEGM